MNVVRTEKDFQPPRKRCETKQRTELCMPPMNTYFQFARDKRPRRNLKSTSSNWSRSSKYPSAGRGRGIPTSSSYYTSKTRNHGSRSGTRTSTAAGSSMVESATGGTVLAITTGRGDARSEVGIAAFDIRCSHLVLCQISDTQTFTNALTKLYLFDPFEVLIPDTMCERAAGKAVLYRAIMEKFPDLTVTPVSRIHFNDATGFERIKTLCVAEYSPVELFVKQKYYALAAAAALLKYVEYAQRIVYAPKSLKIEFHGSPNATTIDLESARSLELVQSQCSQRNVSLLGIMDRCLTPMGKKLMRANILQPPCKERTILERQAAVAELVSNRSLRALVQPIVRRLYGADRLLGLSISPIVHENTVQCAEHNLSYVLLLKNLLDGVPELGRILVDGESDLFRKIQKTLGSQEFRLMRERILETIHPDARSVTGYTSLNMQRCFAIKAGINDLLDVARQTYCELIDDMKTMVENLASKYRMSLSLSCNASLGYHIQAVPPRNSTPQDFEPPNEFIEVRKDKRTYTMTTSPLAILSQQCKISCEELHLMSNVLLCDLLQSLRNYIGCMFQLSADIAELDLVISLAEVSSLQTYVRPTFGTKLELLDSRHPVLEVFGFDSPVPNHVNASIPRNMCIISGPNMSGKSTYLKQIVLLHIMAQLGCFVPARKAIFRITDLISCKIAVRNDIECNASTFALEMKEVQYILRSVTPTSLIVLDELCKGTSIEEGASIAWAICERLLTKTAFTFAATHFSYLTKLADVYCNVTNLHFETVNTRGNEDCQHRSTYTHHLIHGIAPMDDYGIGLAEFVGLPKSVTEKARKYAFERVVVNEVTSKCDASEKPCYDAVVELHELLETEDFIRGEVNEIVQRIIKLWKQKDGETGSQKDGTTGKKNESDNRNDNDKENLGRTAFNLFAICSQRSAANRVTEKTDTSKTPTCTNADWREISTVSVHNVCSGVSVQAPQIQTEPMEFQNTFNSERNEHYSASNKSFTSGDLSFCSIGTNSISHKSEQVPSTSGNFKCAPVGRLGEQSNSVGFSITNSILSSSFIHESPATQMSISTLDRSMSKLYEYCLSDYDFEPDDISQISILTNVMCADTASVSKKDV